VNFYQHQEQARKQTGVLIALFLLAVTLIVIAINAVAFFVFFQIEEGRISLTQWIQSPACWIAATVTLGIIIGGSVSKAIQLSNGGAAVAVMAGGNYLSLETKDPQKKQLINVVEEMAIASGIHVPQIFILEDEAGINAFVAGTSPNDAALAITQGALDSFNRDELQGVIGHEFSHILNGDMNINIKLISVLAGILLIGKIGESLTRSSSYGRHRHSSGFSSSRRSDNKGWAVGLALMAVGYIGLFFGRLIKAAISRQREFLADASAVQFTRNPNGIGQALFAIQSHQNGSLLSTPNAEDMSHLCFGEAIKVKFSSLLATHPPLNERIKAIDPSLPARLRARQRKQKISQSNQPHQAPTPSLLIAQQHTELQSNISSQHISSPPSPAAYDGTPIEFSPSKLVDASPSLAPSLKNSIGKPTQKHQQYARQLLASIPTTLLDTAHSREHADIIIYILILATMSSKGKEAIAIIKQHTSTNKANRTIECYKLLKQHNETIRLPLLEIATQSLSLQSEKDASQFLSHIETLINLDKQFTLSEFVVFCLLKKHTFSNKRKHQTINRYSAVFSEIQHVLAALSAASNKAEEINNKAFHQAYSAFSTTEVNPSLPSIQQLNISLEKLGQLSPLLKQPIVNACIDCILHDNFVSIREIELLRAICETLDCPMPPLIPDNTMGV